MCSEEIKEKFCKGKNGCNTFKSISEFHKDKSTKDGYNHICKACKKSQDMNYKSKEEYKQLAHSYYIDRRNNFPELIEKQRENYKKRITNPYYIQKRKEYSKDYDLNKKLKIIEERLLKGAQHGDSILYFIKFTNKETQDIFFKIGITKLSIQERYKNSKYNNYIYEIINEFYLENEYCRALEQKLIYEHMEEGLQYVFPENETFNGYTECFTELKEEIINKYI